MKEKAANLFSQCDLPPGTADAEAISPAAAKRWVAALFSSLHSTLLYGFDYLSSSNSVVASGNLSRHPFAVVSGPQAALFWLQHRPTAIARDLPKAHEIFGPRLWAGDQPVLNAAQESDPWHTHGREITTVARHRNVSGSALPLQSEVHRAIRCRRCRFPSRLSAEERARQRQPL